MDDKQQLAIEQRQGLYLTQQQLRFVKLLELNASELEEEVSRELEANMALEVDRDDTPGPEESVVLTDDGDVFRESSEQMQRADYLSAEDIPYQRHDPDARQSGADAFVSTSPDMKESLYDHLRRQLSEHKIPDSVRQVADYIIGSLDTSGYLRRTPAQIVDDLAFGPGIETDIDTVRRAIEVVQSLEPYGVGASDLRECLLIQLRHRPAGTVRDIAVRIIEECYDSFMKCHWDRIRSFMRSYPAQDAEAALRLTRSLNPKPGAEFSSDVEAASMVILPDFIVNVEDDKISIGLAGGIPTLRIEQSFEEAMDNLKRTARGRAAKGSEYVVNSYNDARDFIRVLGQRQQTMMTVMTAIVDLQKEYFLTQDVYRLKPMKIKDISELTGLDISVISRATANKFVQTPWGIFPLRYFFSEGIGEKEDAGDIITNRKIEAEIEAIVKAEDKRHPLSDLKITEEMARRGFDVSRRTVAKYRDRKGIPAARLRRQ